MTAILDSDYMTAEEARRAVGVGRDRWNKILRAGDLPSAQLGRVRYVRVADLRAYIDALFH